LSFVMHEWIFFGGPSKLPSRYTSYIETLKLTSQHTHTHTHIHKNKPSSTYTQHHLSITIVTMPLEHIITYQAFREITNFIRENGDNWGESSVTPLLTPRPQERP